MRELIDTLESAVITGDTFEARLESLADVIWRFYRQPRFVAYEQLTLNLLRDPTMDAATVRLVRRQQAKIGELLTELATQVVDREIAEVLPPAALLQILRGLAIGLVLTDAVPGRALGSYCMTRRTSRARSVEWRRATRCRAMSIPAETPDAVMTGPA